MNVPYSPEPWMMPAVVAAFAFLLYLVANSLLKSLIAKVRASLRDTGLPFGMLLLPIRLLFLLIGVTGVVHYAKIPSEAKELAIHALTIGSIAGVAWLMLRGFAFTESLIQMRYKEVGKGDIEARRVATNVSLIRKILNVLVIILAVSGVLMTFDTVRQIGLSILASAGLAGVVMGFAAQRSLQTLIAGIQIAIAQPVRLDDVVVVENETGRVEEITLTYVVVRLSDQRRIIVPITWFIDRPFQNWTRSSTELIGAVTLQVGYAMPVGDLRAELERIVSAHPLWDKRVVRLEVTGAVRQYMELRALVSAANSVDLWTLRCEVREKLIGFMRQIGAEPPDDDAGDSGPDEFSVR
ncbi:MAG: mechanosensitive ion channel [Chlorobiaceae bacterium]|nr:mechanosensitive ion channel [Chlorobiaceae bacterium]